MDEPRKNDQLLRNALAERNVGLFETGIKKCGLNDLVLIQNLTLAAVNACAATENGIFDKFRKNDFQNIMLRCLEQLVRLSTARTGLQLPSDTLLKCLREINKFTLKSSIESILKFKNDEGLSFLFFVKLSDAESLIAAIYEISALVEKYKADFLSNLSLSLRGKNNINCVAAYIKSGEVTPIDVVQKLQNSTDWGQDEANRIQYCQRWFGDTPFFYRDFLDAASNRSLEYFKFVVQKMRELDGNLSATLFARTAVWQLMYRDPSYTKEKVFCLVKKFGVGFSNSTLFKLSSWQQSDLTRHAAAITFLGLFKYRKHALGEGVKAAMNKDVTQIIAKMIKRGQGL